MISYEQTLRLFSRYISDTYNVEDRKSVIEPMIRQYVKSLKERAKYTVVSDNNSKRYNHPDNRRDLGKRISTSTINNYIRNLKVFFAFMKEQKYTKGNVAEKVKLGAE